MLKEIKNEIDKLSQNSTAYGVPNLLRSRDLFNKIFWLSFIILSSATSCWYVYTGIFEYLEYQQPAAFPTVTVCCRNKTEN